jgi:hypothetical protein
LLGQRGGAGAFAVASGDGGATFGPAVPIGIAGAAQTLEPQVVELADSVLYLKGHTGDFTPQGGLVDVAAVSRDGGVTWEPRMLVTPFNLTTCQGGLSGTVPMWVRANASTSVRPAARTKTTKAAAGTHAGTDGSVAAVPTLSNTLFFSHPNVPAAMMSAGGAANRYNGAVWRSTDAGVRWEVVLSITNNSRTPENMFAYSAMTPLGPPSVVDAARVRSLLRVSLGVAPALPMGVLYETGDVGLCGDDPRYSTPSQSCIVVFKTVSLPIE